MPEFVDGYVGLVKVPQTTNPIPILANTVKIESVIETKAEKDRGFSRAQITISGIKVLSGFIESVRIEANAFLLTEWMGWTTVATVPCQASEADAVFTIGGTEEDKIVTDPLEAGLNEIELPFGYRFRASFYSADGILASIDGTLAADLVIEPSLGQGTMTVPPIAPEEYTALTPIANFITDSKSVVGTFRCAGTSAQNAFYEGRRVQVFAGSTEKFKDKGQNPYVVGVNTKVEGQTTVTYLTVLFPSVTASAAHTEMESITKIVVPTGVTQEDSIPNKVGDYIYYFGTMWKFGILACPFNCIDDLYEIAEVENLGIYLRASDTSASTGNTLTGNLASNEARLVWKNMYNHAASTGVQFADGTTGSVSNDVWKNIDTYKIFIYISKSPTWLAPATPGPPHTYPTPDLTTNNPGSWYLFDEIQDLHVACGTGAGQKAEYTYIAKSLPLGKVLAFWVGVSGSTTISGTRVLNNY